MTLPSGAQRIATRNAAEDRDMLARLLAAGKVQRTRTPQTAFTRDIAARMPGARPAVNLAIRPNDRKKKGRK